MSKSLIGSVSSDSVNKTIVVSVQTRKTHPLYRKQYVVSKKFMAHDEQNEAKLGDRVEIVETRPLSARKHHILQRVVERAAVIHKEEAPVLPEKVAPKPRVRAQKEETL